jgi:hypothetical protein
MDEVLKNVWKPLPKYKVAPAQIQKEKVNEDIDPLSFEVIVEGSAETVGKSLNV